jgi:tRNA G46 methylase TrmB
VAIEKTKTRFSRFQGRMSLEGPISNLHVVRDNAIHWISHHIPANSVERYFIHYPNPYPKLAQRNKRWSVMPFMGFLIETLKPGGEITLSTNLPFYMEETKDLMENYWNLNLIDFQEFSSASGEKYATQFEKKYLERGQTCYRMVFQNPPKGS